METKANSRVQINVKEAQLNVRQDRGGVMWVPPWAGVASLSGKVAVTMQSLSLHNYTVAHTGTTDWATGSSPHGECAVLVADLDASDVDADLPSG